VPGAYAWYQLMQEIVGVIEAAGLTPSATDVTQLQQALEMRYQVPTGSVVATASSSPSTGWLLCDGSAVSRDDYPALFAAIGTTFGAGDGSTTFNVPDLRGEFIRGADAGRGVDAGRALGSSQAGQVQTHKHASPFGEYPAGAPFGHSDSRGHFGSDAGTDNDDYLYWTNDGSDVDGTVNPPGVIGTETRPRNVALNYIIRT
jgi:phage-related tail fiber protein